jgi:hypothetical protein
MSALLAAGGPASLLLRSCLATAFVFGLLAACDSPAKLTPQEAAIATEVTKEVTTTNAAIAGSRYRMYRWLTPEEMAAHQLGYDPTMDPGTRYEVEQTIDDELANKGYQKGAPADFTVAFSDSYLDPSTMTVIGIDIHRTPEEKFTIAFFDAQTGRLLWRGWGKEDLSENQASDEGTIIAVTNALEDMPIPLAP